MFYLLKWLLMATTFSFVKCSPQFNIGAIFDSQNSELEFAFRSAVERNNIDEPSFKLIPVVVYASNNKSFLLEKAVCNLVAEGVIAIFGPEHNDNSDIVASMCNTLDIPHFIYDWSPSEDLTTKSYAEMSINLHPNNILFSQGIAEIVQNFDWRSYTLIYETEKELLQLQNVLQSQDARRSHTMTIVQLPSDTDDYTSLIKDIETSSDDGLILHCSIEKVVAMLEKAKELKTLEEHQMNIFLPMLDAHTVDFSAFYDVANITSIRLGSPIDFKIKNGLQKDEQNDRVDSNQTAVLLISDAILIFVKGLSELNIVEDLKPPQLQCHENKAWNQGSLIVEFIKTRSRESTSGQVDFNEFGQRNFFTLQCIAITESGLLEVAAWDPINGYLLVAEDADTDKSFDFKLQNKTFFITSRLGAPYLMHREPKDGEILEGNARYEGYSMDLIDEVAKMLNFNYKFQLVPDGKYGNYNKRTKQWNGIIKELLDRNADLGISDLTMTSARRQVVEFSSPFMALGISILYVKPEVKPPNLFSFLLPFSIEVWLYMGVAYLGVSLLIFVLSCMAPKVSKNPQSHNEDEKAKNIWTLTNVTWLTMGSLMAQGCDILPRAFSTRLVTALWWFFALMMLNSYTANLAAFLTMSRRDSAINSAEDLAAQNNVKYGAVAGGSTLSFIRNSNFNTYQRMWAAMESDTAVLAMSNAEGVDRVLKEKGLYAFLMESTTLEYAVERNCDLVQIGDWLDYKTYGIAMPLDSPYRQQINEAILKLGETGILIELKRKWWNEMNGGGKCENSMTSSSDTPQLDLQSVGGLFLVLSVGLLCAVIIGLAEFLWHVKKVAVEKKITLIEALKKETLFALKFWKVTKPVQGTY